jgi:hypothetical protein
MNILSQYKASLKHPGAEELLDLYLFRPIAFLLARVLVHTSVTPNQITAAAILSGFVAGAFLATGDAGAMTAGALLYALSNTLDCCDGMVARLKGNGTELGRMVDVFADLVTGSADYTGLGIGLSRMAGVDLPVSAWFLVVACGISYAIQSAIFDRERNRFLARVRGDGAEQIDALDDLQDRLWRHEAGGIARTTLIRLYISYMRGQSDALLGNDRPIDPKRDAIVVRLWSLIGSTTHVTVFVLAIVLGQPMILFTYTIVAANIWAACVRIYQRAGMRIDDADAEENRHHWHLAGALSHRPHSRR